MLGAANGAQALKMIRDAGLTLLDVARPGRNTHCYGPSKNLGKIGIAALSLSRFTMSCLRSVWTFSHLIFARASARKPARKPDQFHGLERRWIRRQ